VLLLLLLLDPRTQCMQAGAYAFGVTAVEEQRGHSMAMMVRYRQWP
jgi:hypothetical protein